ncbi:cellulose synthase operon protein YhjQ [Vibrio sp. S17_S38]|uniref:cellulose biosynthesis protein BcsQ n=1 Tax=Vibrio sp. S17_S38 TaxID=2720229 RepID=UPI00168182DE|nr:cellulose biosynthesis protein BcsQ [Vibrio sp. S17_S38]MBD1574114.1 cellulose synthase operon protein YhjQ [Vibrio sp. S17_S38]
MKRIVITGVRGGVGATTIAANLTIALNSIEQKTYAIDTNSSNLLRLYFCMEPNNTDGWAQRMLNSQIWKSAGYQNSRQISFVPFGALDLEGRDNLSSLINELPNGLNSVFKDEEGQASTNWQIILLPEVKCLTSMHSSILASADMVLCVTNPDIQNYISLQQDVHFTKLMSHCQPKLLINRFMPVSDVSRDMLLVLQNEYQQCAVPIAMHEDTAISEAITNLGSVLEKAPYSQAAQDYHALAFWCLSYLNQASQD